jgi:hypothetical protein
VTFLEKSAWVMIAALLLSGALYFNGVIAVSAELGHIAPPNIGLIAFATVVIIAVAIFGHVLAALGNPADADAPEDERDRTVAWRAGNTASYVLSASVLLGICAFALIGDGNLLFHLMVGGLIAAQVAEYALTILFYRRGV